MKNVLKRIFCFCAAIVCGIIFCTLKIIVFALRESSRKKEYEPTRHELICGEKTSASGRYYVPDEKHK